MKLNYVQIGCKDVDKLTKFYESVCDFTYSDKIELLNGKKGKVMIAPGFKGDQIYFGFIESNKGKVRKINDRGFAHICFETDDVKSAVNRLKKYGGSFQSTLENPETKPCVYCKDIEGNIVEFHIPFPSKDASIFKTLTCLLHLKKDKAIINETKPSTIKFIHVNIITEDWRDLCDYYNNVVASTDTGKIKDHEGTFKEQVIGVDGVHVIGKHILLPGFYKSYPTLEIFTYSIKGLDSVNDDESLGVNAIGFKSNNIKEDIKLFEKHGGKFVKDINENVKLVFDKQGDFIYLYK